jgi:hypothetical protein
MRIDRAFPLDDPPVEIPWHITESAFRTLVPGPLEQVAAGRLRRRCRLLNGIEGELMFHFGDGVGGQLCEIELLRYPRRHREREFQDLQQRLEHLLGPGERLAPSLAIHPPRSQWRIGRLSVVHEYYTATGKDHEKVRFCRNR